MRYMQSTHDRDAYQTVLNHFSGLTIKEFWLRVFGAEKCLQDVLSHPSIHHIRIAALIHSWLKAFSAARRVYTIQSSRNPCLESLSGFGPRSGCKICNLFWPHHLSWPHQPTSSNIWTPPKIFLWINWFLQSIQSVLSTSQSHGIQKNFTIQRRGGSVFKVIKSLPFLILKVSGPPQPGSYLTPPPISVLELVLVHLQEVSHWKFLQLSSLSHDTHNTFIHIVRFRNHFEIIYKGSERPNQFLWSTYK